MEPEPRSLVYSKASLLSTLASNTYPQGSSIDVADEHEFGEDVTDAAVALSAFLSVAYRAQLVPRSMQRLTGLCTVDRLGEGADYRVELYQPGKKKPFVVKYVKALAPVLKPGGIVAVAAAPRLAKVLREILIAQHLSLRDNRHILHLEAYGWDYVDVGTITPCLILEYAEHGNMRQYLEARSNDEPDERYLLWKGVTEGLFALHSCEIVHGDVKLDNILIAVDSATSEVVPKITDFGSSLFRHPDNKYQRYLGTAMYNAPEVYAQAHRVTNSYLSFDSLKACDAYSLGLLVWETFRNGNLYFPPPDPNGERNVCTEDLRELALQELDRVSDLAEECREQIRVALQATIHENSSGRKTMEEILTSIGQVLVR